METNIPDEKLSPIKDAIFRGRKIDAIKLYREASGLGLAEAKTAVERLETELRASVPYEFKPVESRGCLGMVLLLVILTSGLVCFTFR